MKSKAAQYLNEIVSLTILSAMVVALIAGQAAADSRALAADASNDRHESRRTTIRFVVEPDLVEVVPPLVDAILGEQTGNANTRHPLGK